MKRKNNYITVIVIAALLLLTILMDTLLVFGMNSRQTVDTGKYQLESISGELESTINEAKNLTMQLAIEAQIHLDDKKELEDFIYDCKDNLSEYNNGGYNIYMAGTGWDIIPGLVKPKGYDAKQRTWYTGAARSGGSAYVTPPYSDAATGNICYSVSVMLADNDTVLAIDYTMENIQAHVVKMNENGLHNAVIVTEDGIIAGGSDETLVGDDLSDRLPQYTAVFHLAKNSDGFVSYRIRSGMHHENLFAARSGSGWYLIVSESDWELYRRSYIMLLVTTFLILALMSVIIGLYLTSLRSRRNAEEALRSKEEFLAGISSELEAPLKKILGNSDPSRFHDPDDAAERFSSIHDAGEKLSYSIRQILTYSDIVKSEKNAKASVRGKRNKWTIRMNKRFRNIILLLLLIVMAVSLSATAFLSMGLAKIKMQSDVNNYEHKLSEWIFKQKSILDTYANLIASDPAIIDDYDSAVRSLDSIAKQYPEVSAVYIANPEFDPNVYMNNGWKPDENFHVEERAWYTDTLAAKDGWSISAPYYDGQTGIYCITISEQVHDEKTGEFLGNLGMDFYMDKLVDILGDSYSNTGYAFLADASGDIINHPYGTYQMSVDSTTNISELNYGEVAADGSMTIIRDYDNSFRIITAKHSELSNFTVYKVTGFWDIYGQGFIVAVLCFTAVSVSIIIVYVILSRFIIWQDSVNRRMKKAASAAKAADAAKGRFLAQMSHEIRTPINAILGMNEMILHESDNRHILEYSENIRTAGKTLLSLINSILDFSKIEDGKMEIIPVKYDTSSFINNLVNSVSERAAAKGLEFVVNIDPLLPSVLVGDDVRLTQVIMNLLTNAVKYTEKGTVTLGISAADKSENSVTLAVSVKDTGIGIREEDMDRLFESFARLDEKRNRSIEGTGLGMSIVTKLLALMKSRLMVESAYGEGSVFSFEIVQEIADPRPIGNNFAHRKDSGDIRKKENIRFKGADILVTDDNDMNLRVAKNLLRLFGIETDTASSGYETIEKMSRKHYDIVFLDHMMPQMDGIETLAKLKERELIPRDTVVIALTANAVIGAKETYIDAGFSDYLSKPIELDQLGKVLAQYLSDKSADDGEEKTKQAAETGIFEFVPTDDDEIMEFSPDDGSASARADTDTIISQLENAGISVNSGLQYCGGDKDFYIEMLTEYAQSAESRMEELNSALSENDISRYQILVHALKSVSKTVGADDVSELARSLEEAAKRSDPEYIRQNNERLKDLYSEKASGVKNIITPE